MRKLWVWFLLLMWSASFAEPVRGFYVAGGFTDQRTKARMQSQEVFDGQQLSIDASDSLYNTGGTAIAGYQFPTTGKFVAMLEAGRDFGVANTFSADAISDTGNPSGSNMLDVHWKITPTWFLAFKPGIQLSDGLIAYASVALHGAEMDFSRAAQFGQQRNTRGSVRTIGGTGVGLGVQGKISERVFVRGEVENVRFSRAAVDWTPADSTGGDFVSRHSVKAEAIVGRLILGYRF